MVEKSTQIRSELSRLKAELFRAVDLFERGEAAASLNRISDLTQQMSHLAELLSSDYHHVLLNHQLAGHHDLQLQTDALLKKGAASGNGKAVLKVLLSVRSHVYALENEVLRNYPIESTYSIYLRRHKKQFLIGFSLGLFLLATTLGLWRRSVNKYGLKGAYFNNEHLQKVKMRRVDGVIDFNFGGGSPAPGIHKDHFSIRWEGFLYAPLSGVYSFQTESDDGVRLWIGSTQLIDDWHAHHVTRNRAEIKLDRGYSPIKLEYFDDKAAAVVRLFWKKPGDRIMEIIDRRDFISSDGYLDKSIPVNSNSGSENE